MKTYDFVDGYLLELINNKTINAWSIYDVPTDKIRAACAWNDKNGEFDNADRLALLECFLHDFIVSKKA